MLDLLAHCTRDATLALRATPWSRRDSLVRKKSIIQYMTRTGQKTGMLKISKKVQKKEMVMARVAQYQNLNSGSRRIKGLNSSSDLVGRVPTAPSSISLSRASLEGSNLGWRKARKRLSR